MKVLYLHGYGVGGSGSSIYARNLVSALRVSGHDVVFCVQRSSNDSGPVAQLQASGVKFEFAPPHCLATTYRRAEFADSKLFSEMSDPDLLTLQSQLGEYLRGVLVKHCPDAVIANHFLSLPAALRLVPKELVKQLSVVSHGTDIEYAASKSDALNKMARHAFEMATLPVALTQQARDRAAEVLGVSARSFAVIPPGIDAARFRSHESVRGMEIALVGRVILDKGPHMIIAALPRLLEKYPALKLVLVGDGPDREVLQQLVAQLDEGNTDAVRQTLARLASDPTRASMIAPVLSELCSKQGKQRVRFLRGKLNQAITFSGQRTPDEVSALLNRCRVAVLPSMVQECFPLTLMEALASGCSIIASRKGTPADLLDYVSEVDGRLREHVVFEDGNVQRLIERVEAALDAWNEGDSLRLSDYVRRRFSWNVTADKLLNVKEEHSCPPTGLASLWPQRELIHS